MKKTFRLLLVEDSPEDAGFLLSELRQRGYSPAVCQVASAAELREALKRPDWDLVIADSAMPGFSGKAALEEVRRTSLDLPFIFVSGTLGENSAAQAIKSGANDCILKGDLARLGPAIERELREAKRRAEKRRPEDPPKAKRVESPVGFSPKIHVDGAEKLASERAKLLLVDDHPENLMALEALLSDLGRELVKAGSGEEALRLAYDGNFALILLDVRMPGLNGFETAELLRKTDRTRRIPVIFLTANGDSPGEVQRGYRVGAVDYITKPIVPEVLKSKVRVFLDLFTKESLLRERTARLEELNRELETFTYTVSHDLRAPVRAVREFSQILLKEYGDLFPPAARAFASRIDEAGIRMENLIEGLLTLTHLKDSEVPLGPMDVDRAVNEALSLLAADLRSAGATIEVERPLLGARGHDLTFVEAIVNLVSNALKFTQPGVPPRVRISTERRRDRVRLQVEDNGIGIAPEHHSKIFGVFERLHAPSRYKGSGLGLAIVSKAMERMGGACGVESALGQGSRFWLELPPAAP